MKTKTRSGVMHNLEIYLQWDYLTRGLNFAFTSGLLVACSHDF